MLVMMIKVGLLSIVNNVFAEEESTVIMISDITIEYEETSYGDLMMAMMMNWQENNTETTRLHIA